MSYDLYYDPNKLGLETVGEIDWIDDYGFDLTVVWRRKADGVLLWAEDSGCSCPSPFEDTNLDDLKPIPPLAEFQAHLVERSTSPYTTRATRDADVVELLERLHKAGAR